MRALVPNRTLILVRLECSTSMYNVRIKHGYTRSSKVCHGLNTIYPRFYSTVRRYGLLWCSTVKHDFNSIYSTFTGFTYGPADLCSSKARIYTFVYVWFKLTHFDGSSSWIFVLYQRRNTCIMVKTNNDRCNRW